MTPYDITFGMIVSVVSQWPSTLAEVWRGWHGTDIGSAGQR